MCVCHDYVIKPNQTVVSLPTCWIWLSVGICFSNVVSLVVESKFNLASIVATLPLSRVWYKVNFSNGVQLVWTVSSRMVTLPKLLRYLTMAGGRKDWFLFRFSRVLARNQTQTPRSDIELLSLSPFPTTIARKVCIIVALCLIKD